MRWVQHLTLLHMRENMAAFLDKYGAAGYGTYWIIAEVAASNSLTCVATYPLKRWATILMTGKASARRWLERLSEFRLAEVGFSGDSARVAVLDLKVCDNDNRPPIGVWIETRKRIFERDDYTCKYCSTRGGRMECDHIFPVSKGGSHEDDNLATACFTCNRSKRDKTVEEWLQ